MSDTPHWLDPNGLIVIGATLVLISVVIFSAACFLPFDFPPTRFLLAAGGLLTLTGGSLLWIGIRRRSKHSDLSVPLVVGVEMVLCGSVVNWMIYAVRDDDPGGAIPGGTVIIGGIALLVWVIRRKCR